MEYKEKEISLNGNLKLISKLKKAGIECFNPLGEWNGYGYKKYPMHARIKNRSEMIKFNRIKKEIEQEPIKILTEEEKIEKWAKRLSKLTSVSLEEALEIANDKIEYHEKQIENLVTKPEEYCTRYTYKLIKELKRQNPLRYIKDIDHAFRIVGANRRHNRTNYEEQLERAKELRREGVIDDAKDYALSHCRNYR